MIDTWRDALISGKQTTLSAAESTNELLAYTTTSVAQLSALTAYSIYEIGGADAETFLQGQLCNDLALVTPSQAQITGYCTPKGRLLALPTIVGFDAGYRLLVPNDIADTFMKRLSMFIMRSDVTVKALEDWAAVGITQSSTGTDDEFASLAGPLPESPLSVVSTPGKQLIRWHDDYSATQPRARYLRLATHENQAEFWSGCTHVVKTTHNSWRLADISAGIPSITEGIIEAFVPQMINLQLINGLSFKKGCYPGQEIVARMQYLGKLKRHMRVFNMAFEPGSFDINENLKPGSAVCAGVDENAGIVVDALPTSTSTALVLAVTKVTASEHPLTLAGIALTQCDMPYELPSMEVA